VAGCGPQKPRGIAVAGKIPRRGPGRESRSRDPWAVYGFAAPRPKGVPHPVFPEPPPPPLPRQPPRYPSFSKTRWRERLKCEWVCDVVRSSSPSARPPPPPGLYRRPATLEDRGSRPFPTPPFHDGPGLGLTRPNGVRPGKSAGRPDAGATGGFGLSCPNPTDKPTGGCLVCGARAEERPPAPAPRCRAPVPPTNAGTSVCRDPPARAMPALRRSKTVLVTTTSGSPHPLRPPQLGGSSWRRDDHPVLVRRTSSGIGKPSPQRPRPGGGCGAKAHPRWVDFSVFLLAVRANTLDAYESKRAPFPPPKPPSFQAAGPRPETVFTTHQTRRFLCFLTGQSATARVGSSRGRTNRAAEPGPQGWGRSFAFEEGQERSDSCPGPPPRSARLTTNPTGVRDRQEQRRGKLRCGFLRRRRGAHERT